MSPIDTTTQRIFRDPVKRRAWIIYQLSLQGRSMASLARDLGVARGVPRHAFTHPYPRMERAIAEAVDVPVHLLFPDRYAPDGERLIRMGRPAKSSTKSAKNSTQSRAGNDHRSKTNRQGRAA